ncbi:MAG: methylenetetrahydrofolate reductase [Myxococcota bacterium]
MRVADLYGQGRPIFSFEFFPPRTEKGAASLLRTARELAALSPDFISVTCPLDKPRRPRTFELVATIKRDLGIETMAHLVTVDYTREEMRQVLALLRDEGIENVLALRGDLPEDAPVVREFQHGSELASLAKEFGFCVGGAAHPELHPDSTDWEGEIRHARGKVDAGCDFLITQLFFDDSDYFAYVDRARAAGIEVPIVAGIMPVTSVPGIQRMAKQNGNRIPDDYLRELVAVQDDPAAVHALGVRYATDQCVELVEGGAPGIHFYTLNRSPATREILTGLRERLGL